jgi:hypothetical protein
MIETFKGYCDGTGPASLGAVALARCGMRNTATPWQVTTIYVTSRLPMNLFSFLFFSLVSSFLGNPLLSEHL